MADRELPEVQHAVQLVGPGRLIHNTQKPVIKPGPHQVLVKVEAVGLCFSDLKLLKQFSGHPRKSEVTRGLSAGILREIPSYAPWFQSLVYPSQGQALCILYPVHFVYPLFQPCG